MDFNHKVEKSKMINPMSDSNAHLKEQLEEYQVERYVPHERVTATRWVEIANKKWMIQRFDPHGYWKITPPTGVKLDPQNKLTQGLRGNWTVPTDAQRAIEHYVNTAHLEPVGKAPQVSRVRRRRTEIPAAETVEAINL